MNTLDEELYDLEREIVALCKKRDEYLMILGVESKYLVYDSQRKDLNSNTWVLTPERDMKVLKLVSKGIKNPLEKRLFDEWLEEYKENSCTDYCEYTGTPVCCQVCFRKEVCDYLLERCRYPELIEDVSCERRGKFK